MTIDKLLMGRNSFFPNHRLLFLLAGLFLTITIVCPQKAAAQTDDNRKWLGSYTFEDMAKAPKRRNVFDIVPGVIYDINVEEKADGKLLATLNENGVQVYQAYECSVKISGDKIEFYYERFAADVTDLSKFKKGDLLFTLVEAPVGKQTKYLFQPAAYKISRYEKIKQKQPIYFDKQ